MVGNCVCRTISSVSTLGRDVLVVLRQLDRDVDDAFSCTRNEWLGGRPRLRKSYSRAETVVTD